MKEKMKDRYRNTLKEFMRARRYSPCTKDYVQGRLTEIREIMVMLFGEEGRQMIDEVENE